MKGSAEIIDCLNALLTNELTAIDQYFVQARMLEDWGFIKLYERISHEADDERGHADRLVKRILFFEGQPDVGSRAPLKIGSNPNEMLANDLEYELEVARTLNEAIALCRKHGDNGTREMLEELLRDTEDDHILWLEQQLSLIEKVGLKNYLSEQL
ncbi:MAG TPA: bacterioferritin [Polyangiales bacterium]|nr:bacterioferritin [Polyangiales bacterium]